MNKYLKKKNKKTYKKKLIKRKTYKKKKSYKKLKGGLPQQGLFDVKWIDFTQKSISHRFSRGDKDLDTTFSELKNIVLYQRQNHNSHYILNYHDVENHLPQYKDFFNLNIIIDDSDIKNKRYYSCENRRLCILKHLKGKGYFDGKVMCTRVSGCHHDINLPNQNKGPFIQMGNRPGKFCSDHLFE